MQREIALDGDDVRWLFVQVGNILRGTKDALPPQGVYNAGQKLFAIMVYVMLPMVMITGLIMAFHLFSTTVVAWAVVAWAVVLHFFSVGMVVSGLMIHVYVGAVFPEDKPAFFSKPALRSFCPIADTSRSCCVAETSFQLHGNKSATSCVYPMIPPASGGLDR